MKGSGYFMLVGRYKQSERKKEIARDNEIARIIETYLEHWVNTDETLRDDDAHWFTSEKKSTKSMVERGLLDDSDTTDKIISDCLEAIVGAIYLDGGLKFAEKFILNFWKSHLEQSIITLVDSKTQLQEFSLKKFKELPKYIFHKKTGPEHQPLFKTEVQIPNSKKIFGTGTSKKNAQQSAAAKLIKILKI